MKPWNVALINVGLCKAREQERYTTSASTLFIYSYVTFHSYMELNPEILNWLM